MGAASGGVRRRHREILRHLPAGRRRHRRYVPDRRGPGRGERGRLHIVNDDFLTAGPFLSHSAVKIITKTYALIQ